MPRPKILQWLGQILLGPQEQPIPELTAIEKETALKLALYGALKNSTTGEALSAITDIVSDTLFPQITSIEHVKGKIPIIDQLRLDMVGEDFRFLIAAALNSEIRGLSGAVQAKP